MNKSILLLSSVIFILSCARTDVKYLSQIEDHRLHVRQEFKQSDRSPLKDSLSLSKLSYFKTDPSYCLTCTLEIPQEKEAFEMATYSGINKAFYTYGIAHCSKGKQKFTLHLYKNIQQNAIPGYKTLLFLPFKDETNDDETYGGGRYIDLDEREIIDNTIVIDFNKAYNPWCAYGDGFHCPIPPVDNHLNFKVKAGEKGYYLVEK